MVLAHTARSQLTSLLAAAARYDAPVGGTPESRASRNPCAAWEYAIRPRRHGPPKCGRGGRYAVQMPRASRRMQRRLGLNLQLHQAPGSKADRLAQQNRHQGASPRACGGSLSRRAATALSGGARTDGFALPSYTGHDRKKLEGFLILIRRFRLDSRGTQPDG